MSSKNPLAEFQATYSHDWVGLVKEVLGADPDEWQIKVLRDVQNGTRRISIRSGHGTGKSTVLAWCIICHALTRFPQKTVCTAPTTQQLFDALAAETKAWFKKLPKALMDIWDIKSESIDHKAAPDESFISFRTSRPEMPEALAGVHSENVLLIVDEASGVPESVYVAASGSMSGHSATTILAGNPVRTQGLFFETHMGDIAGMWQRYHVPCVGHPRISQDFIQDMQARYGEDTNDYRVRVLGEFPKAEADTVIPYELIQLSLARDVEGTKTNVVWGVDCARFGADRSALAKRKGNLALGTMTWKGLDTMELTGRIKAEWDRTPTSDRPDAICVDAIGLGAGVADRLRELGLPAQAINVSEAAAMSEGYVNQKAELWFTCKEWFAGRACSLNGDTVLAAELSWPRFTYTSSGKLKVEGKVEMKKRTKKSPDVADAFVLTFAAPAVSALYGSQGSTNWKEPLKREVKWLA